MMTKQSSEIDGKWTSFTADGYRADNEPVPVRDNGDGTISIGRHLHRADELSIAADRIEHLYGGWYLTR